MTASSGSDAVGGNGAAGETVGSGGSGETGGTGGLDAAAAAGETVALPDRRGLFGRRIRGGTVELRPLDWTGLQPPAMSAEAVPHHVAVVMDGNGRWANARGLPRIDGHRAGEESLLDVVAGAVQIGVKHLSVYVFSTENWKRSPDEVRFLMGFNRDVIARRREQFNAWNVKIRWAGRKPRLWASVLKELMVAEEATKTNTGMTLTVCVNYGGRNEIVDAVRDIADDVAAGRLKPSGITSAMIQRHLYTADLPDVDLFVRSSGEQRTSNFLLWQSAYAEMVFLDTLWPDFSRLDLWEAVELYASRARRFGGAVDALAAGPETASAGGGSESDETDGAGEADEADTELGAEYRE